MATEHRLIDLDKAMEATRKEIYWTESRAADVRAFLIQQPRVDAVPVVRCKDCKNSRPLNKSDPFERKFVDGCVWCMEHSDGLYEDDFCSYGERRTDNG